ncbi:Uncharacterised protein [Bordetella pertussis]|nr:Uncharacterised protein [Bordetella pertussis]
MPALLARDWLQVDTRLLRARVRPVEAAWGLRDAGQDWLRTWADMASADGAVLRRQP